MKKIVSILLVIVTAVMTLTGAGTAAGLPGDTNGDGEINNKDVVVLFRFVSGGTSDTVEANCDFNADNEVNNKDVAALFRYVSSGVIPDALKKETTFIDFGDDSERTAPFFAKESYCKADFVEDGTEGKVLRISTKNIGTANQYKPQIFFRYADYSGSIGEKAVNFAQKPFVVLKVKAENVNDRLFSLNGAESENSMALKSNEVTLRVPAGDGWQYICFDCSKAKTPETFKAFRIGFEQLAAKNGESFLISEMRVCTAEEAAEYVTEDVYPLTERTADDYGLKIVQFNVQTENGNGAPFIVRSEMYRKLLDTLQPDVVGMQEVTTTWRKWLDSYVFNDSYAGVGEPRESYGEANPVYYRKDKFELVDSGTFWLSDTPDVPGSKIEKANYARICTWVILKDKVTGTKFIHMNTHLDHNGNNNSTDGNTVRKQQMGVILKFAQQYKDLPMFLTGDLNNRRTTGEGKTYALIKYISGESTYKHPDGQSYSLSLGDARLEAPVTVDSEHTASMTKYYDETGSSYDPAREPIDYIFYNPENTVPLTYETFLITENSCWISDHLPLFATFRINPPVK